ncbi:MAG: WD40 repeat domain-containing protein [Gemmataceae bacterium]
MTDTGTGAEHALFRGGILNAFQPFFTPDGRYLIWANGSEFGERGTTVKTIVLRPLAGGPDREFTTEQMGLRPIDQLLADEPFAYSSDGKLLAAYVYSGEACVWDIATGEVKHRFSQIGVIPPEYSLKFGGIRFTPDNSALITGQLLEQVLSDGRIGVLAVHDLASEKSRLISNDAPLGRGFELTPDGKTIFTLRSHRTITSWDLATGKEHSPIGHKGPVTSAALSPDGRMVATASQDKTVRIWDRATGKELKILDGFTETVIGVAFLADDKLIAAARGGPVIVSEIPSGKELRRFWTPSKQLRAFALSPDRGTLALGGLEHPLQLWNTNTWSARNALSEADSGTATVGFTPDSGRFVTIDFGGRRDYSDHRLLQLCDTASGKAVKGFQPQRARHDGSFVVSPTGDRVLSNIRDDNSGILQEWELATGKVLREVEPLEREARPNPLAWSPDGRLVAVTAMYSRSSHIEMFDTKRGKVVARLPGHSGKVNAAIFTSDSKFLISGSDDGRAIIWELAKFLPR